MTLQYDLTSENELGAHPIYKGDDYEKVISLTDQADAVIPLTGYSARMQIRPAEGSDILLHEMTVGNGGIVIDAGLGTVTLVISDTDTAAFEWTEAVYDLELTDADGKVRTYMAGAIEALGQVTS